jgi:CheY-like chemotaxis protein
MSERPVLLVIQDSHASSDTGESPLEETGLTVRAARIDVGYETARAEQPDLIAIDVAATSGSPWTLCRLLKADPQTAMIPVILLAARDAETAEHARYAGAHAVVTRPFSVASLGLACRSALAH